jgi:hypothetical protein
MHFGSWSIALSCTVRNYHLRYDLISSISFPVDAIPASNNHGELAYKIEFDSTDDF